MEGAVFCIGNPLLDISAEVPQSFIDKYQLTVPNAILAEEQHLPIYAEMMKEFHCDFIAGGAGQNTARSCQWMLPDTPNVVSYVGCIGNDENAERLASAAAADGVKTCYLRDGEVPTGTCAVLIREKDRSMVANLSAANHYKREHYDSETVQGLVSGSKFCYCSSFFLTVCPSAVVSLGEHCASTNKPFMINLAAPFLIEVFADAVESVMPFADIVMGNEFEGEAYRNKYNCGETLQDAALALSRREKRNAQRSRVAIITQGDKPTIVACDGKVTEYPPIPITKEDIVDLNGAGDCFAGGFIAAYVQGYAIDVCVAAGNHCAHCIIKTSGIKFDFGTSSFVWPARD